MYSMLYYYYKTYEASRGLAAVYDGVD